MNDALDPPTHRKQTEEFFEAAQEFAHGCFQAMIQQIDTLGCDDGEKAIFTAIVARSHLGTATDFLLEMEDDPMLVGEIVAGRVNARNQRKTAEKVRLLN